MVDLREGSPTFLKWHAVELTPETYTMAFIPEGCAHGFQTLEDDSELLYFHTAFYNKEKEGGVCYNDARIGIRWPLPEKISPKRTDPTRSLALNSPAWPELKFNWNVTEILCFFMICRFDRLPLSHEFVDLGFSPPSNSFFEAGTVERAGSVLSAEAVRERKDLPCASR